MGKLGFGMFCVWNLKITVPNYPLMVPEIQTYATFLWTLRGDLSQVANFTFSVLVQLPISWNLSLPPCFQWGINSSVASFIFNDVFLHVSTLIHIKNIVTYIRWLIFQRWYFKQVGILSLWMKTAVNELK